MSENWLQRVIREAREDLGARDPKTRDEIRRAAEAITRHVNDD